MEEPGRAVARGIVAQVGAGCSLWEQEIPAMVLLRAISSQQDTARLLPAQLMAKRGWKSFGPQ